MNCKFRYHLALLFFVLLSSSAVFAAQILLPASLTVAPGQSVPLQVTLGGGAPSGGVFITLATSDASKATVAPQYIFIPEGSSSPSRAPVVTGIDVGAPLISASAFGWTTVSVPVQVGSGAGPGGPPPAASMSIVPASLTVNGNATQNLTLNLSPAPSTAVMVLVSSSNTNVAAVPSVVSFNPGSGSTTIPVTGAGAGSATITASATGVSNVTATVNVIAVQPGSLSMPANTSVQAGQSTVLSLSLGAPAPAGGIAVALVSGDTSRFSVTPSAFIPAGATTPATQIQINGLNPGLASITATASGYTAGNGQVQVTAAPGGVSSLSPASLTVNANSTGNLTLILSSGTAPGSGLTAALFSSNPAVASVPASVFFAPNTASVNVPVTGVASGNVSITASTPNFGNASASVTVSAGAQSGSAIIVPSSLNVAPGQSAPFPVTLGSGAPAGGMFISLTSSDPSKVTIAPAAVFIPQGSTSTNRAPVVTGADAGSATITASAFGFAPSTGLVQVGSAPPPPVTTMNFSPASLAISGAATQNLLLTISSAAPAAGLTVSLASSNSAVASVAPTVSFQPFSSSASVAITGISAGSTTITASASGMANATAGVSVTIAPPATINVPANMTVTVGQSAAFPVSLLTPAPAGGLMVTLASSDASKATVTANAMIAAGTTSPAVQPQISGVAPGLANISATAAGFTGGNGQVQAIASGGSSLLTPQTLTLGSGLSGTLTLTLTGGFAPAGGLTASLNSSNTAVASVPPTVLFAPFTSSVSISVSGTAAGAATITASTPNFGSAGANISVSAPASRAGIIVPPSTNVPPGQSVPFVVVLGTAAPAGGMFLTLSSSDASKATVSPANIFIAEGSTTPNRAPVLTGLNNGVCAITASAFGYTSATGQAMVSSGAALGLSPGALTLNATTTQNLTLTVPSPAPAGGQTISVSSDNAGVASVPPSVTVPGNATTANVPVTGVGPGSANITAGTPGLTSASATVTVVGSTAIILPGSVTLGTGASTDFAVKLAGPAPAGGVFVSLSSSDPAKAAIAPATLYFAAGATTSVTSARVTGVAIGSASIIASAPGLGSATQQVTVSAALSIIWQGACWVSGTIYGVTGHFQAMAFDLTTPTPVTVQASLFFNDNCDPRGGVDNMNDWGATTSSARTIQGFSFHPDVIPSSALFWVGPRTADGLCPAGVPCSGCVKYNASTPDCSMLP